MLATVLLDGTVKILSSITEVRVFAEETRDN
jgi:hypothetical protein